IIVLCSLALLLLQWRRVAGPGAPVATEDELDAGGGFASRLRGASARTVAHAAADESEPRARRLRFPPVVGRVLFGATAVLLLFFFIAPIVWMAIASVQTDEQLSHLPPHLTPNLFLDGYFRIVSDHNWQGSLIVSLVTAIATTAFVIVLASPVAYSLAR